MRTLVFALTLASLLPAADLSTKKSLNLPVIKEMVAAAEAKAAELKVSVTICIVDESGNLLFLQKGDRAGLNTIQFAQKKARHSAFFRQPSANGAEQLKSGNQAILAFPEAFPNQGGLPILTSDRQSLGGIGVSGAPSAVDEQIAQAALDTLKGK